MTSPGEETREFYRQQGYAEGFQVGYDAGNEMMAKAVATAELLERKRIIKLLETELFITPTDGLKGDTWLPVEQLIALIKGENR